MPKPFNELTFTDDFMFCKVMVMYQDLCRRLLELILDIKIQELTITESQKSIDNKYSKRGIRLDVYARDADGTVYDIEMQTTNKSDLPLRLRYYQSAIDMDLLEKGDSYSTLPETRIIFLCLNVPFEGNLPVYTFENMCAENTQIRLKDKAKRIVLNASGVRDRLSDNLKALLDYMVDRHAKNSPLIEEIDAAVDVVIQKQDVKEEYMRYNLFLMDAKDEGRAEGRAEGEAKAINKLNALMEILKKENRLGEFVRVISDTAFREKLFAQYKIA